MSISAVYTNVRNNTVVETIKNVVVTDGIATVEVESAEFDGLMTVVDNFFATIPVLVVK